MQKWLAELPRATCKKLAEIGLIDREHAGAAKPLSEHCKDYAAALRAKGTTDKQVKLVTARVERMLDACGFRYWSDIAASKLMTRLHKLRGDRRVIMSPTCYKVLEEVSPPGTNQAWVFQNQDGLPIQDQGTRERLQRYATKAGVMLIMPGRGKHAGRAWSRANWKMLRNYFVSRAASGGISFIHVREATGHDSYRMVRHYFRLNDDAYRKDFRKFGGGLTGIDLNWRAVTRQSNTPRKGVLV